MEASSNQASQQAIGRRRNKVTSPSTTPVVIGPLPRPRLERRPRHASTLSISTQTKQYHLKKKKKKKRNEKRWK